MANDFIIRPAEQTDLPAVKDIYNHYILNTAVTFATQPDTDASTQATHTALTSAGFPYVVAARESSDEILGYSYVSPFQSRRAGYQHTVTLSLYCHPEHVRKGVGRALLDTIISILKQPEQWRSFVQGSRLVDLRAKQLLAIMAIDTEGPGAGLKLRDWYMTFGFSVNGHLKGVGWKRERWIDTLYLQMQLRD